MRILLLLALICTQSCVQLGVKNANVCDGVEKINTGTAQEEESDMEPASPKNDSGDQLLILNRMISTL